MHFDSPVSAVFLTLSQLSHRVAALRERTSPNATQGARSTLSLGRATSLTKMCPQRPPNFCLPCSARNLASPPAEIWESVELVLSTPPPPSPSEPRPEPKAGAEWRRPPACASFWSTLPSCRKGHGSVGTVHAVYSFPPSLARWLRASHANAYLVPRPIVVQLAHDVRLHLAPVHLDVTRAL